MEDELKSLLLSRTHSGSEAVAARVCSSRRGQIFTLFWSQAHSAPAGVLASSCPPREEVQRCDAVTVGGQQGTAAAGKGCMMATLCLTVLLGALAAS